MTKEQKYQYKNVKKRIKKRIRDFRATELEKLKEFKKSLLGKEETKNE